MIFLALAHFAIGANPAVAVLAALTVIFATSQYSRHGFSHIGAILVVIVAMRYVGFPLGAKLLFGQPLDSNLDHPFSSFLSVLLGVLAYMAANWLAKSINVGAPWLKPVTDSASLRLLSFFSGAIGIAANLASAIGAGPDPDSSQITVAEFFHPLIHLSLISAIASVATRSEGKRSWDLWGGLVLLVELGFALSRNSRMAVAEIIIISAITVVVFRGSIRWRHATMLCIGIAIVINFVSPVFLYVRDSRHELDWQERISQTFEAMGNWSKVQQYIDFRGDRYNSSGHFLEYFGSEQNVLERISLINHTDVIVSNVQNRDLLGFEDLEQAFVRSMPRVIAPNKPRGSSQGDWLYCKMGIRCVIGSYSTIPLIANGYAAFGLFGVIVYPLLFGLVILLSLKKFCGLSLIGNVWAIYFLLRVLNTFVEGSTGGQAILVLRKLPQDFLVLLGISIVIQYFRRNAGPNSKLVDRPESILRL